MYTVCMVFTVRQLFCTMVYMDLHGILYYGYLRFMFCKLLILVLYILFILWMIHMSILHYTTLAISFDFSQAQYTPCRQRPLQRPRPSRPPQLGDSVRPGFRRMDAGIQRTTQFYHVLYLMLKDVKSFRFCFLFCFGLNSIWCGTWFFSGIT